VRAVLVTHAEENRRWQEAVSAALADVFRVHHGVWTGAKPRVCADGWDNVMLPVHAMVGIHAIPVALQLPVAVVVDVGAKATRILPTVGGQAVWKVCR
jgi:hypothetical protein